MSDSDIYPGDPPDPVTETKLRVTKARETTRLSDEARIDPPPCKKGDTFGGFLIERLIGSGVTSSVYRARELKTGRIFALKILRTRCEETRTASRLGFRRIQPLSHPSLIHIFEMIQLGSYIGFQMEYVAGKRLWEVIRKTPRDDRSRLFEMGTRLLHDVGGALGAIHGSGSVHRDVKPENVMLDSKGRFRLIDYGLVGSYDPVSDPDARRNYLAGTYWYMAPESITSQIYPPACDVYALGCIVLELIADHSKLPAEQAGVSLGQSIGDVRSFLPSDTPPELADLLCDMLDSAPQNRPVAARLVQVGGGALEDSESQSRFRQTHLYGREKEMAIAERWVHGVVGGRPSRLHISGESGVGKTWFLAELLRRIRANAWFQVFDSACHERAGVSLQAFDAMADAIARRYSRDDREPLKLETRHALLLRQAFPSLRGIIVEPAMSSEEQVDARDQTLAEANESPDTAALRLELARSDALSSGVELVDRMCEYGPLFLIVDDSQWADQDSINILDKLLTDAKGEVGIISIGRTQDDQFRKPADCSIELGLLSDADAKQLLRSIVCHNGFEWELTALKRLAALGEGNTYRLTQLAACVSGDGTVAWHERLLRGPVEIEDIWQSRLDHLSVDGRQAIEFMAIAGGPIRANELAQVSELMGNCDEAVRELVGLRLVYDEAPKREAIDIVHLRIRRCIIQQISPARQRTLHVAWASYLMTCDNDPWQSARIAGHLLDAAQFEAAVPHIVQAARDAEARFAIIEAARWHLRAASLLNGDESASHLLQAIHQFEDAGQASDAAAACRLLMVHSARPATLTDLQLQHRLAKNLLHAGHIDDACDVIDAMAGFKVGFSADQESTIIGPDLSSLASIFRSHRVSRTVPTALDQDVASPTAKTMAISDTFAAFYCPLLTIDVRRSNSLLFAYLGSTDRHPHPQASLQAFVDMSVIQCRNNGPRRRRMTKRLSRSVEIFNASGDRSSMGTVNSGLAFRHLLSCDWASAVSPATKAIESFQMGGESYRFDKAHSYAPLLWSYFWLGRIADLKQTTGTLLNEMNDLNDEYLRRMIFMGLGAAVPLIDDDARQSKTLHRTFMKQFAGRRSGWWTVVDGFSPLMRYVYEGREQHALRYLEKLILDGRGTRLRQVQSLRILYHQWEATMRLRLALKHPVQRNESIKRVTLICHRLDQEKIPFARTISQFLMAQASEVNGDKEHCLGLYHQAADAADSLDLIPIRLAAIDRMSLVKGEKQASELKRFLTGEGVAAPEKFARLYCGLC